MKKIFLIFAIFCIVGCSKSHLNQIEDEEKDLNSEPVEEVKLTIEDYINNNVNELGKIPIMMYHGIHYMSDSDTKYIGGNVDRDGYHRTSESFEKDLEFFYSNGYRMISLKDYINGEIDVELGKSPIVLTFDDGLENNIKVTGLDENGDIIIDPNSAAGILEKFKHKYKDYNVTATFFVNGSLFNQPEYNDKILNWLVDNGYDVGNHTYSHVDFSKIDSEKSSYEVGKIYDLLDKIIPNKYVFIVALPFGSPYNLNHENMQYIYNSQYESNKYVTNSTLRVGWESEYSPFNKEFNPKFLKRIRAYDNNGEDFDIEMNFKLLNNTKYISDGDSNTIVIKEKDKDLLGNINDKNIIMY